MTDAISDRPVAVITGAAHGLGAQIAERLLADGFSVALLDVHGDGLAAVAERLSHLHPEAEVRTYALDLSDEARVAEVFTEIEARWRRVDALVNTAGGSGTVPVRDIEELSLDAWTTVLRNNITSAFLCARYAVPIMRRRNFGRIVNFSSGISQGIAGPTGTVGARLAYATSKGAVNSFTKQLAKDLALSGITVNALSPGLIVPDEGRIRTMFSSLSSESQAAIRDSIPMGRPGTGEEVAAAVSYLVSAQAGFTSGAILSVDGAAA